jgi:uncharacterized protein
VTVLLDGNVLIALVVVDHVHHDFAEAWLKEQTDFFATCPITQGTLLRILFQQGHSATSAKAFLTRIMGDSGHTFWTDSLSYLDVGLEGIIGYRQVTDAYLAQLARANQGRLATFDRGLAALHSDVADLVPTGETPP